MARGFESKDVEYQQAERERLRERRTPPASEAERAAADTRASIELTLVRLRADRARAEAAAHRAMLDQAIATLEARLSSLQ
jgi:hypothetical protein